MLGQPPLVSRTSSPSDEAGWLPLATGRVVSSVTGVICGVIAIAAFAVLGHSLFLGLARAMMGAAPVLVIIVLASPRILRRQTERSIVLAAPPIEEQRSSTPRAVFNDVARLGGAQALAVLLANPLLIGMGIGASLAMLATWRQVPDWEASNRQVLVSLPSPNLLLPPRVARCPVAAEH
jgi:hypothetical protein